MIVSERTEKAGVWQRRYGAEAPAKISVRFAFLCVANSKTAKMMPNAASPPIFSRSIKSFQL